MMQLPLAMPGLEPSARAERPAPTRRKPLARPPTARRQLALALPGTAPAPAGLAAVAPGLFGGWSAADGSFPARVPPLHRTERPPRLRPRRLWLWPADRPRHSVQYEKFLKLQRFFPFVSPVEAAQAPVTPQSPGMPQPAVTPLPPAPPLPQSAALAPAPLPPSLPPSLPSALPPAARPPAEDLRHARIGEQLVQYRLRRSKRRTIGFLIDARGLSITAPHRVALAEIDRAIAEKERWIARKLVEWREHAARREKLAVRWSDGGLLPLLGATLTLSVEAAARTRVERDGERLRVRLSGQATEEAMRHAVHAWIKAQARALFAERLAEFERRHGVAPARWSLSSARTRWGSCSASGAIRLNWRLLHFPLPIVDYVIAHELAHLAELNHGPRFWARVTELYPDWQGARRWLREFPDELASV